MRRRRDVAPVGFDARVSEEPTNVALAARRNHQEALALLPGATGAATAVRVGLGVARRRGVQDDADGGQVEATRGDVGRHQDAHHTRAERLQRPCALRLREFARQRNRGESVARQSCGDVRSVLARVHEHENVLIALEQQQVQERRIAVFGVNQKRDVLDVGVGFAEARAFDVHRLLLIALGDGLDPGGERRADEVRAAILRSRVQDRLELVAEAHVEHLVGLVEDDLFDTTRIERAALDVIEHASRRADDDARTAVQLAHLELDVGTAGDDGDLDALEVGEEPLEFARDLVGQFASRGQDEGGRAVAAARLRTRFGEDLGEREADGHGLAGARLRRDLQVALGAVGVGDGELDLGQLAEATTLEREAHAGRRGGQTVDGFVLFRRLFGLIHAGGILGLGVGRLVEFLGGLLDGFLQLEDRGRGARGVGRGLVRLGGGFERGGFGGHGGGVGHRLRIGAVELRMVHGRVSPVRSRLREGLFHTQRDPRRSGAIRVLKPLESPQLGLDHRRAIRDRTANRRELRSETLAFFR